MYIPCAIQRHRTAEKSTLNMLIKVVQTGRQERATTLLPARTTLDVPTHFSRYHPRYDFGKVPRPRAGGQKIVSMLLAPVITPGNHICGANSRKGKRRKLRQFTVVGSFRRQGGDIAHINYVVRKYCYQEGMMSQRGRPKQEKARR